MCCSIFLIFFFKMKPPAAAARVQHRLADLDFFDRSPP